MDTELKHFEERPPVYIREEGSKSTFSEDDDLPSLPLPDLNHSLDMYLDSAIVHLTPSEYRRTRTLVEDFRRNAGPRLHEKLAKKAAGSRNWLEDIWLELAYHRDRTPLIPNCNMNGPGPYFFHYWRPEEGTQLFRSAVTLYNLNSFRQLVRQEKLPVERKASGKAWCMDQYRKLFNTCRIPGETCDHLVHLMKTAREQVEDVNSHVIVFVNGRIYKLEMLDESGKLRSIPEIHFQLKRIKAQAENQPRGDSLVHLTSLERTKWFHLRQTLLSLHPRNAQLLATIESAAMCLTLDPGTPRTHDEIVMASQCHGQGEVWADKSYNVFVFTTGVICVSCDHSPFDGATLLATSFFNDLGVYKNKGYAHLAHTMPDIALPEPQELQFVTNTDLVSEVNQSREEFKQRCEHIDITLRRYRPWNRRALRRQGFNPDTVIQQALQLAYFRLHDKPAPTYETASTRTFFHGRTETLRSCTPQAVNFCRAVLEPGCDQEEKRRLFVIAHDKHDKWRSVCEGGHGCDRHLLGLMAMAMEEGELPEIFTEPAWVKSGGNGNFVLSTSTVGYSSVIGHVAAMHQHGYGFFYRMGQEMVEAVITNYKTSKETDCRKLADAFTESFAEIQALIDGQTKSKL